MINSVKNKNFIDGYLYTLISNILIMTGGLISGSIIARLLSPQERGDFASIQLYGALFASMVTSGLPAAVTFFTGKHPRYAAEFFINGILFASIAAIPIVMLGYIIMPLILVAQSSNLVMAARFYLFIVPLGIMTSFCLASFQGQMKMREWNFMRTLATIMWVVPLLLILVRNSTNPIELSELHLFVMLICSLIFVCVLIKNTNGKYQIDFKKARIMWRYALPTSLSIFVQQSNLRLDQIFITAMLSPYFLGIYVVAFAWSAAHYPIINAIGYVIVPHLSSITNNNRKGEALARIARTNVLISIVCAVLVALSAPTAISVLFGEEYEEALHLCYILVLGSTISSIKLIFAEGLRGSNYPIEVMKAEILGIVVSLILFPLMLLVWGLNGLAFASAISHLLTLIFLIFMCKRLLKMSIMNALIPDSNDIFYIVSKIRGIFTK